MPPVGVVATLAALIRTWEDGEVLNCLPEFDPKTGLLPPGRYAATLDHLHVSLVESIESTTRREIWEEWAEHRATIELLTGEITRMWVGGSFVSDKSDPGDVDVTYLVGAQAFDRLDQETLSYLDDLTLRGYCVRHGMRVDAYLLRLPQELPVSRMIPSLVSHTDNRHQ